MPRKIYNDWITIRFVQMDESVAGGILNCARCGQDMQIMLPMALNSLWALSSAFGNIHNLCEEEIVS